MSIEMQCSLPIEGRANRTPQRDLITAGVTRNGVSSSTSNWNPNCFSPLCHLSVWVPRTDSGESNPRWPQRELREVRSLARL